MRKVLVIAVREYQAAVRTKMFIITLVLMPVLFGGSIAAHLLLKDHVDTTDRRVAVVDRTGVLYEAIAAEAKDRNTKEINDPETGRQIRPRFLFESVPPDNQDPAGQRLALSDQVRDQKLFAFVDIEADAIHPVRDADRPPVSYYSNNPTYDDIETFIQTPINDRVRALRLEKAGIDKSVVDRATRYVAVENLGLVDRNRATGEIQEAQPINKAASFLIPMALMMLMFMVVMVGATPLMQGVLEEKMQRIAEVLLGSVTPFQLMAGKLLGVVGVSMTLVILYMGAGVFAAEYAGYGALIPRHLAWWFVAYQVMAVFLFGSMFTAVGAACSDLKEAQSAFMPVWIVACIPLFVWFAVVREPMSTFSTVISLFPPATPMLMLARQAAAPAVPVWQPLLGLALTAATTVLCVFAAGRIFRVGLLMQGKGADFRQMIRWAIRG